MKKLFNQKTLRFIVSGGLATLADLAVLYLLTEWLGIWYLLSAVAAFLVAFIISFVLQKFWTFEDSSINHWSSQAVVFFFVAVFNLGFNTLLMYLLVDFVHLPYLLAQIFIAGVIAVNNYFVYGKLVFKTQINESRT